MEYHTQLKSSLSNRKTIKAIINQPSTHATLIIGILNIMARNQILTSNVDWRIISLQIVRNRTLQIRKLTGTWKSLKTSAYRYMEMDKTPDNSTYQSEYQKIYMSMAPMYSNAESHIRYFEDSLQLSNCIIYSGAIYNITSDISYFILVSLVETDNYM